MSILKTKVKDDAHFECEYNLKLMPISQFTWNVIRCSSISKCATFLSEKLAYPCDACV